MVFFDEKSSLFITVDSHLDACILRIWYMERVFFCVIRVVYDMIYPFTDFAGAMLLGCLQKWLTCVLDPQ